VEIEHYLFLTQALIEVSGQLHAPVALSLEKEHLIVIDYGNARVSEPAGKFHSTERACSTRSLVTIPTELPDSCNKQ